MEVRILVISNGETVRNIRNGMVYKLICEVDYEKYR